MSLNKLLLRLTSKAIIEANIALNIIKLLSLRDFNIYLKAVDKFFKYIFVFSIAPIFSSFASVSSSSVPF
ncbi:MAG: hypothetical protein IKG42_05370 [Clostridia bacterium]|nr:hypothetical protein [Clostridia bacterium]